MEFGVPQVPSEILCDSPSVCSHGVISCSGRKGKGMARSVEESCPADRRACRQQMPRGEPCSDASEKGCVACGKEVCVRHLRKARVDRAAPGGGARSSSETEECIPEICITCCVLEFVQGGERIEEIDDDARARFYASEAAAGLLGPDEIAWLEARGLALPHARG